MKPNALLLMLILALGACSNNARQAPPELASPPTIIDTGEGGDGVGGGDTNNASGS